MYRTNFPVQFAAVSQMQGYAQGYNQGHGISQPVYQSVAGQPVVGQRGYHSYVPQRPVFEAQQAAQPKYQSYNPAPQNVAKPAAVAQIQPVKPVEKQAIAKKVLIPTVYTLTKDHLIVDEPKPKALSSKKSAYSIDAIDPALRIKTKDNLDSFPKNTMTLADRRHASKGYRSHVDGKKQEAAPIQKPVAAPMQKVEEKKGANIPDTQDIQAKLAFMEAQIEKLKADNAARKARLQTILNEANSTEVPKKAPAPQPQVVAQKQEAPKQTMAPLTVQNQVKPQKPVQVAPAMQQIPGACRVQQYMAGRAINQPTYSYAGAYAYPQMNQFVGGFGFGGNVVRCF